MKKLLTVSILFFTVFLLAGCDVVTPQKEIFNVSFVTNSTSTINDVDVEESTSILEPVQPTKDGSLFAGWYSDSTFLSAYDFSSPVIGDLVLHAKWVSSEYIMTFETNGGNTIDPLTVDYDATLSIDDPVKEGYAFIDWYLDVELTEEFDLSNMPDTDLDLFAKWQINLYTITFDTTGGSLIDSITYEFNASTTAPTNPFLEGYAFRGWYQFGDFVGGFDFDTMPGRDVDLVAAWELDDPSYTIAMITDSGMIDDESYNQATWEGIVEFAVANDITHKYYKPLEVSDDAYLDAIELAIYNGAEVIVTPGFLFESSVYLAQDLYPNVKFIILDGVPHNPEWTNWYTADNTMPILFNEHEAGFLAGYAAVMDGYTELGFMGGMAVPAVVKFGIGYIAGAFYAAEEMGINITLSDDTFTYLGAFWPDDNTKNLAASWYVSGTEVIFAAAGGAGASVMAAAADQDAMMIGVDIDQSAFSNTVLTSAMKGLSTAVKIGLQSWLNEEFMGGETLYVGADYSCVGLPLNSSRFSTFSTAQYVSILNDLIDGTVVVPSNYNQLITFLDDETLDIPSEETVTGGY